MKKIFLTKRFLVRPRPRPRTLLVLSLGTFKVVTRLAGPSSQVSSTERQGPVFTSLQNWQQTPQKLLPTCPSSNPHTLREPSSLFPRKLKDRFCFFHFFSIFFYRNSTKLKSETSPIVSSFTETGDKVTISEHQKSNKEDMLQKFPPKNILQKRFYCTDGRLNWGRRPSLTV